MSIATDIASRLTDLGRILSGDEEAALLARQRDLEAQKAELTKDRAGPPDSLTPILEELTKIDTRLSNLRHVREQAQREAAVLNTRMSAKSRADVTLKALKAARVTAKRAEDQLAAAQALREKMQARLAEAEDAQGAVTRARANDILTRAKAALAGGEVPPAKPLPDRSQDIKAMAQAVDMAAEGEREAQVAADGAARALEEARRAYAAALSDLAEAEHASALATYLEALARYQAAAAAAGGSLSGRYGVSYDTSDIIEKHEAAIAAQIDQA